MQINRSYINKKLGVHFSQEEVKVLLEKMGYGLEANDDLDKLSVLVPAYRADILHPIDLVEDVAIAFGYENFVEEIPDDVEQVIYHDLTLPAERAWQLNLNQAIDIQLEKALRSESTIEFWIAFERDEVTQNIPVLSLKNGVTTVLELSLTNKSRIKISADLITQETKKPLRLNGAQYHVAIVYVNSALSLFINGRLISSNELKDFSYDNITLGSKDAGLIQFDELLVADNV